MLAVVPKSRFIKTTVLSILYFLSSACQNTPKSPPSYPPLETISKPSVPTDTSPLDPQISENRAEKFDVEKVAKLMSEDILKEMMKYKYGKELMKILKDCDMTLKCSDFPCDFPYVSDPHNKEILCDISSVIRLIEAIKQENPESDIEEILKVNLLCNLAEAIATFKIQNDLREKLGEEISISAFAADICVLAFSSAFQLMDDIQKENPELFLSSKKYFSKELLAIKYLKPLGIKSLAKLSDPETEVFILGTMDKISEDGDANPDNLIEEVRKFILERVQSEPEYLANLQALDETDQEVLIRIREDLLKVLDNPKIFTELCNYLNEEYAKQHINWLLERNRS